MKKEFTPYRFVFAGGGTGGHLYPAIAVAQQIKALKPESEILFVGTKNKIEARVVPQLGFNFKTIWISGLARKFDMKNILFPFKVAVSVVQSLMINFSFKPRVAVGCGAYVAGPVIWSASVMGSKIILLEQNSYPGITNRLLEKKADRIHITFEDSRKYFREKDKLELTGNPIRINLRITDKSESLSKFGLNDSRKTLLVLGGSLGAKSINEAVAANLGKIVSTGIQVIWQTGAAYYESYKNLDSEFVKVKNFVDDMSAAYSACDLVLARSGATTIAEAALLGSPVVFVPSTNVAANHQYKNAMSLKEADAAEIIEDKNLAVELFNVVSQLINNNEKLNELKKNIARFAKPDAALTIAKQAINLAERV